VIMWRGTVTVWKAWHSSVLDMMAYQVSCLWRTAIHAVDKVHAGTSDSSVMYIPCCPLTETNAEYLVRQREAFSEGRPAPDFPGETRLVLLMQRTLLINAARR